MNWGIFVVKTQPNKFFIFEREFSRQDGPTGKTRLLAIYSSYSVIQMRYPLHELIEMPGFFSELPFQDQGASQLCPDCELPRLCNKHFAESVRPVDSLTGGACGPGKDRCYIFDPCKNHRQQPVEAEQPKPTREEVLERVAKLPPLANSRLVGKVKNNDPLTK